MFSRFTQLSARNHAVRSFPQATTNVQVTQKPVKVDLTHLEHTNHPSLQTIARCKFGFAYGYNCSENDSCCQNDVTSERYVFRQNQMTYEEHIGRLTLPP